MAWALVQDKNGSIWFSQADSPNPLWRFDPSTKKFESIRMVSEAPYQMRIDQNTGNIWFTTFTDNKLGVIQKIEKNQSSGNRNNENSSQYKVSEFNLGNESFPSGLYLKGDSVWVTQSLNNKLVQFKMITGRILERLVTFIAAAQKQKTGMVILMTIHIYLYVMHLVHIVLLYKIFL